MNKHSNPIKCFLLLLSLTMIMLSGCAGLKTPDNVDYSALSGPIEFYRGPLNHLNAVREGSCPMHPSCSAYAKEALEKHGPLIGGTMTFDRLIRCGRDETELSREVYINNQWRIYDPVQNNDFWWNKKEG
jgi:putative component of membrane protein insertase Oxa1/YidC/SpoIIIJ protein YidD